ncbi:hypothetical protein POX_c04606 [Penicillium oxalicum]|uniref:hypothetical protein n=1 Tax=Penicillium oxalicum TaxID=69781 RepID=UPI0020B802C6|nr:hypothetical protein POX_c04606 [Penicillium oxalicum]KAI2791730.1 hypothetical protein POX_c04606 [Penicillium oxalicum]
MLKANNVLRKLETAPEWPTKISQDFSSAIITLLISPRNAVILSVWQKNFMKELLGRSLEWTE